MLPHPPHPYKNCRKNGGWALHWDQTLICGAFSHDVTVVISAFENSVGVPNQCCVIWPLFLFKHLHVLVTWVLQRSSLFTLYSEVIGERIWHYRKKKFRLHNGQICNVFDKACLVKTRQTNKRHNRFKQQSQKKRRYSSEWHENFSKENAWTKIQ